MRHNILWSDKPPQYTPIIKWEYMNVSVYWGTKQWSFDELKYKIVGYIFLWSNLGYYLLVVLDLMM